MAKALKVPLTILTCQEYDSRMREMLDEMNNDLSFQISSLPEDVIREVPGRVEPDDLLIVTTAGSELRFRSSLGRIPEEIVKATKSSIVIIRYPRG